MPISRALVLVALVPADQSAPPSEAARATPSRTTNVEVCSITSATSRNCRAVSTFGALQLFFGGETRWFVGATLVTIAIRLSYRPFDKGAKKA